MPGRGRWRPPVHDGKVITQLFLEKVAVDKDTHVTAAGDEIPAKRIFTTPKGEQVLDFGQNMAGRIRAFIFRKAVGTS